MYLYLYSNTKIPEDFKKEIFKFQTLKNVNINGIEFIEAINQEKKLDILYHW